MELCPDCHKPLTRTKVEVGYVYVCPRCNGLMATMAVLRKLIDRETLNSIWQWVRQNVAERGPAAGPRLCPGCGHQMAVSPASSAEDAPLLDICLRCQLIWLDADELDRLPHLLPPMPSMPEKPLDPQAAEALGMLMLESVKNRQDMENLAEKTIQNPLTTPGGTVGIALRLLRHILLR